MVTAQVAQVQPLKCHCDVTGACRSVISDGAGTSFLWHWNKLKINIQGPTVCVFV